MKSVVLCILRTVGFELASANFIHIWKKHSFQLYIDLANGRGGTGTSAVLLSMRSQRSIAVQSPANCKNSQQQKFYGVYYMSFATVCIINVSRSFV
jgi:hypothetical protein